MHIYISYKLLILSMNVLYLSIPGKSQALSPYKKHTQSA